MLTANILNLFDKSIYYGTIHLDHGRIAQIDRLGPERVGEPYVLPGFVDAHVHVESSLLTPVQFGRMAVVHGTVSTVSDPHEIGNVLGVAGVEYMLDDAERTPFKFCFGAPSCVPATPFETAGATIGVKDVKDLLGRRDIGYLAEMMNFPGVLNEDPDVMMKIAYAKAFSKPVDGHAPGLRGNDAQRYIDAGIETDHECTTYDEGLDKARRGMNILIREGSAARNFDDLIPLVDEFPQLVMFCSDDKHPDTLAEGHINQLVVRAIRAGYNRWNVLRAACINPVLHYRLPVGLLREGDPADYILVSDLIGFKVLETVINGVTVAKDGQTLLPDQRSEHVNQFNCPPKDPADFWLQAHRPYGQLRVIEAIDGQLITNELHLEGSVSKGAWVADPDRDILKIVVVNRYADAPVAIAFIKNFGLRQGAIASSVGHDSHNITAVGCDDESLCQAVNAVIQARGGLSAVGVLAQEAGPLYIRKLLPLPVAGLMTDVDGYVVAEQYTELDRFVKDELGSTLAAPFMTLSFMALLVIPSLKLSDKGLFDGRTFRFTGLEVVK
ncbi:adenine deaminase [Fibrella forsythiae]|uniref:Adenine deaminase n=1 Tax=Fibrella forsythiae TaxID=2817061 RepID=A0ABS3JTX9_9BACT|nr:adenine deaminase [Fibrella forsythiae]MBO0952367.1 adenine deaminase [Fibrella forsythiae]